jgi:cathepsin E
MAFLWLLLTLLHTFISASAAATTVVQVNRNPITLELSRYVNATGMRNLVAHDRARAKALRQRAAWQGFKETQGLTHEPIVDVAVAYVALVGVGNPSTTCMFIYLHN